MNRIFTLLLAVFCLSNIAVAQQNQHWCGQKQYKQLLEQKNPEYREVYENAIEHLNRNFAENPQNAAHSRGGVVTIPIVFHVVYNTSAENLSENIIQQQVAKLNEDFSTSYQQTQASQFVNLGANPMIQFCLASTDPNGNATTGITRTQTSVTEFTYPSAASDMKSNATGGKDPWPFSDYYNVWTCDIGFNGFGVAGYATLPGLGSDWEDEDGAVMSYNIIGANETTLTHESGHYLGLNHPWGDTEACNTDDDGFTDTPEVDEPNFFCPLSHSSCGSLDNVENFMDYADCPTMFTPQQISYMQNILSTAYSTSWPGSIGRASLLNSDGCNGAVAVAPVADFVANQTVVPVGTTVNFTDLSTNTPTDWDWDYGDGGTAAGVQNPSYTFNSVGFWTVELTASNSGGSDSETKTNYIEVTAGGSVTECDSLVYLDGEFLVQINAVDAPTFVATLIDGDQLEPNTGSGWPTAANGGSAWLSFYEEVLPGDTNWSWGATSYFDPADQADNWINFGPITIPSDGASLSWNHSMWNNGYRDGYEVLVNTVGTDIADFNGATVLFSVTDDDPSTDGDTDWAAQSVTLSAGDYAGQSVYIGFHHNATDMWGLLLDEFYMEGCNSTTVSVSEAQPKLDFTLYPNPSTGAFRIVFGNSESQAVQVDVVNTLGQTIYSKSVSATSNSSLIDLRGNADGVYSVIVSNDAVTSVKRIVLKN